MAGPWLVLKLNDDGTIPSATLQEIVDSPEVQAPLVAALAAIAAAETTIDAATDEALAEVDGAVTTALSAAGVVYGFFKGRPAGPKYQDVSFGLTTYDHHLSWLSATESGGIPFDVAKDHIGLYKISDPIWLMAYVLGTTGQVIWGIRRDLSIFSLSSSGGGSGSNSPTKAMLWIAVGQSNMVGRATDFGLTLDPHHPRCFQYTYEGTLELAADPLDHTGFDGPAIQMGPGFIFLKRMAEKFPEYDHIIVPCAYGGTGFHSTKCWDPTTANPANNLAQQAVIKSQAAYTLADAKYEEVTYGGMIWHQGEGDSGFSAQYAANIDALIAYFRAQLGVSTLPFVMGQMCWDKVIGTTAWPDNYYFNITQSIISTPGRNQYVAFAPGLREFGQHIGDATHLNRRAQEYQANSMADAMEWAVLARNGTGPFPPTKITAQRIGTNTKIQWAQPLCKVTSYVIEYSTNGTTWINTGVSQLLGPLDREATITGVTTANLSIRISTVNAGGTSEPNFITI